MPKKRVCRRHCGWERGRYASYDEILAAEPPPEIEIYDQIRNFPTLSHSRREGCSALVWKRPAGLTSNVGWGGWNIAVGTEVRLSRPHSRCSRVLSNHCLRCVTRFRYLCTGSVIWAHRTAGRPRVCLPTSQSDAALFASHRKGHVQLCPLDLCCPTLPHSQRRNPQSTAWQNLPVFVSLFRSSINASRLPTQAVRVSVKNEQPTPEGL